MFRFVVLDIPQIGALAAVCVLAFVMYMLYRDTRLLVQMLIDLKEEVTITRMETTTRDGPEGVSSLDVSKIARTVDNKSTSGDISDEGVEEHATRVREKASDPLVET